MKTSFLYFLRNRLAENPDFINDNKTDLCASLQHTIVSILMDKLVKAAAITGAKDIAIAGGVSANSGLIAGLRAEGAKRGWNVFVPERKFTTDNAAMIAITGYYKLRAGKTCSLDASPYPAGV